MVSTVEGRPLDENCDLRDLLCRQITSQVRFAEALEELARESDLLIEVGPGSILTNLAKQSAAKARIALDCGGSSLRGLLTVACAAFAAGISVRREALFANRFVRTFDLDWKRSFLKNPCESVPVEPSDAVVPRAETRAAQNGHSTDRPAFEVLRALIAERMDLPVSAITGDIAPLSDLHLNSITVSQIVAQTARDIGATPMLDPLSFVNLRVGQIAEALEQTRGATPVRTQESTGGIDSWVRAFSMEWVEKPLRGSRQRAREYGGCLERLGTLWPTVFERPSSELEEVA